MKVCGKILGTYSAIHYFLNALLKAHQRLPHVFTFKGKMLISFCSGNRERERIISWNSWRTTHLNFSCHSQIYIKTFKCGNTSDRMSLGVIISLKVSWIEEGGSHCITMNKINMVRVLWLHKNTECRCYVCHT